MEGVDVVFGRLWSRLVAHYAVLRTTVYVGGAAVLTANPCLAGMASVAATYPFDIMRTQFALQGKHVVYKSMGSFISHTYHARGVTGTLTTALLFRSYPWFDLFSLIW